MDKKIIFLDIDGTLTEPGSNQPPQSAIEAITKAREKGNYVFLCTGRNYGMLMPLLKYGFDGVVASSGGHIRYGDKVIYDCSLMEVQKEKLLKELRARGVFCTVECMDVSYTDENFKEFLQANAQEGSNSEMLRWRKQIEESLHILPMKQYQGQPVYKVGIVCQDRSKLEQVRKLFQDELEFCIQDVDGFGYVNGEIVSKEYNKGKGVEKVCSFLGVPLEDTIAFGDSMNDREMLQTAALSICMENGSKCLKELVDDICPAVNKNGIRSAFIKYHLL